MILRKRRKRKAAQALDTVAGVTKVWTELKIGKKAGQGVAKVKKAKLPWLKSKRVRAAAAMALAGGIVAAVGKKMKADPADSYSGPAPSEAVEAAESAPDPPPLVAAPDPDPSAATIPAAGAAALKDPGGDDGSPDEPAAGSEALLDDSPTAAEPEPAPVAAEPAPVAAEPVAADPEAAAEGEAEAQPVAGDEPAADDEPDKPAS